MRRTTLPQVAAAAVLLGAIAAPGVAAQAVADREYGPVPDDREYSVVADREYGPTPDDREY